MRSVPPAGHCLVLLAPLLRCFLPALATDVGLVEELTGLRSRHLGNLCPGTCRCAPRGMGVACSGGGVVPRGSRSGRSCSCPLP